jgi:recombination protein RecA
MAAAAPAPTRLEALAGLRATLRTEHRAASDASFVPAGERLVPTGFPGLDDALAGGFPRGILATLEGPPTSGRSALAARLLATGTAEGIAALVQGDQTGVLYPPALEAAGVALERLLVVPAGDTAAVARAADIILRSGAFGIVAIPAVALRAVAWTRLVGLAHRTNGLVLALGTDVSSELRYFASLRVRLRIARVRWNGGSGPFATLVGYDVRADVVKSKRSAPGKSAVISCVTFEVRGPRPGSVRERALDADADRLRARSVL